KLYYIKELTKTEYIVCEWPSKTSPEKILFKYIDEGCYLDNIYVYNYILRKDKNENVSKRSSPNTRVPITKPSRCNKNT
ncbi:unnamed protein product, partial [marine sediment metagenome]